MAFLYIYVELTADRRPLVRTLAVTKGARLPER